MRKFFLLLLCSASLSIGAQSSVPQLMMLSKAAESGDIEVQKYLAESYLTGSASVSADLALSYKWYVRAAEQNDLESQYILATNEALKPMVEAV